MNVLQGHGNAPGIRNSTDQTGNVTESINLAADMKSPDSPSLRSKTLCTDLSDGHGLETHTGTLNVCTWVRSEADNYLEKCQ